MRGDVSELRPACHVRGWEPWIQKVFFKWLPPLAFQRGRNQRENLVGWVINFDFVAHLIRAVIFSVLNCPGSRRDDQRVGKIAPCSTRACGQAAQQEKRGGHERDQLECGAAPVVHGEDRYRSGASGDRGSSTRGSPRPPLGRGFPAAGPPSRLCPSVRAAALRPWCPRHPMVSADPAPCSLRCAALASATVTAQDAVRRIARR